MSQTPPPAELIDRLRGNLRTAGIHASEPDIQGMIEKGFLSRVVAVEQIIAGIPNSQLPDYLAGQPARDLPAIPAPAEPAPSPPAPAEAPLHYASLLQVAELLRTRQLSPIELAEQQLARIAALGPQISAFQLMLDEQARADAQQAEQEIAAGSYRGPLHGVPVAIKDLLDLSGKPTTAGSAILAGQIASADATGVARLKAAGAVIVGKTRLSEFAYSPGSNNGHYGPTRNPWNNSYDAGGSSSGSAAAVASGLVFAALGTDTGGSIRIPATLCGIVGLKPTFGRVSLHGAVPLSWSLDHLGPLTRSVADAAVLLEMLAGPDAGDARTRGSAPFHADGLRAGVRGLRVGVLGADGSRAALASDEVLDGWRAGLAALERAGATLVPIDIPEIELLRSVHGALLAMEASAYHLPWLRTRLNDYGDFMRQRILAAFAYAPATFIQAQQARAVLRARCNAIFEQIDLLSTPPQPDRTPPLNTPASTGFTGPFNLLGWPAISVPSSLDSQGMPLGVQLVARPWDEAMLLRAAYALERELGQRFTPAL